MATAKKSTNAKAAGGKKTAAAPSSLPEAGKDPKGGLTAKGRAFFSARDGSHLIPGITGPADTPEKMLHKGSFLVRTFTHPRGPMEKNGQPSRLALSAHAWGEKVPKTISQAHTLAAKGHQLLAKYHEAQERSGLPKKATGKKKAAKQATAKPAKAKTTPAKKSVGQKAPAKKAGVEGRDA